MSKKASIIIHIDEDGEIISAKNVDLTPVKYGEKDKKINRTMIGARIFTPNGCCWKKTPSGWQCLPC